jgi:hypothetical protein
VRAHDRAHPGAGPAGHRPCGRGRAEQAGLEGEAAVNASNEEAFRTAFCALLGRIRELGKPLDDAALEPSDLILPDEDATIEDVRKLLGRRADPRLKAR